MPLDPAVLALALLVVAAGAVLQGTIGFGFAILSVPLLTLLDPTLTPIPVLLLALPIALSALLRERTELDLAGLGWIVLGRVPGAFLGAWLLTSAPERVLDGVIGGIVLGAVVVFAVGASIALTVRNRVAAGLASGFSGAASAIGGPPIALLYSGSAAGTMRSSLGAVFTIGIVINLVVLTVAGATSATDVAAAAWLAPAAAVGFLVSGRVARVLQGRPLRPAVLAVSAVSAVALLVRAVLG